MTPRHLRCLLVPAFLSLLAIGPPARAASDAPGPAVGARYDGAHVYLAPEEIELFVKSFIATFGGTASRLTSTTVTPTPSKANFIAVHTPVGSLSVFGFTSPIPYPFGLERTGYLVKDLDRAVADATTAGAGLAVAPFFDPDRPRCNPRLAGRGDDAALLAHDPASRARARHCPGKPRLRPA